MMKEKAIIMVGPRSSHNSDFAVFEKFRDWSSIKERKVLEKGMYFAVLELKHKRMADIYPNLFVQSFLPHSSGESLRVERRHYGAFVPSDSEMQASDDLEFDAVQLYQIKGDAEVELILLDGQCKKASYMKKLAERICKEQNFQQLGKLEHLMYHCPQSAGYFLALRSYEVWSVVVGENTGFSLNKKVLIFDYNTGIPAIVEYNDRHFERM